jgi:GNAT superfamily N-acetyltransferase
MHDAFEEYRTQLKPPSGVHDETLATVREKLATGGAVLALANDEPVGCAFFRPEEGHLYFSRLSVLPAYRRRGIGTALLHYVEKRAHGAGFSRVWLGVRLALPELKARYEGLGYKVVRHLTHTGYASPTYVLMEKEVGGFH